MSGNLTEIFVPKETVNDEFVSVVAIHANNGDAVSEGAVVIDIETSKSVLAVEAPVEGIFHCKWKVNQEVKVGELLATISEQGVSNVSLEEGLPTSNRDTDYEEQINFSHKAEELIAQHSIKKSVFEGHKFVSEKEVLTQLSCGQPNSSELFLMDDIKRNYSPGISNILMFGTSGHAGNLIDITQACSHQNLLGLILQNGKLHDTYRGYKVLCVSQRVEVLKAIQANIPQLQFVVGFGYTNPKIAKLRAELFQTLIAAELPIANVLHPKSVVETSVKMGEGNQIFAASVVSSSVTMGWGNIINTGAIVSHDCVVGNNVHIAPGAILGGKVKVGDNSLIGMGVIIHADVVIPPNTVIPNGTSVMPKDFM